ncbi:uncharacterized protein TNCV_247021 [Trichonephila clavipes]|nr:uncharacterized protein TNCV_247021 [Trichonephila clavipes]
MAKAKKKKKVRLAIKAKKPSAKKVFEEKVAKLKEELENVSKDLGEEESVLEELKQQHKEELTSKEACAEYLKRVLQGTNENLVVAQERLQWLWDLTELAVQRGEHLTSNLERNCEVKRSIFLQQQSELEEKLSRLEDLRQKRSSQLNRLKQVEGNLETKISTDRTENRKDNKAHVHQLLQKREHFERIVDSYCSDSREVFERSLPVYAKCQLEENIRLRMECHGASENLLALQNQGRDLKQIHKTLNIEMETQQSTKANLKVLEDQLKDIYQCLLEEAAHLQKKYGSLQGDVKVIQSKIRNIGKKIAWTEDKIVNVQRILSDQDHYQKSLEKHLKEKQNENGLMSSKILRAGQMVKAKVREVKNVNSAFDWEFLEQMRMLLKDDY